MKPLLPVLLAGLLSAQTWIPHPSGVSVSLRGISAVSPTVVWASGAAGTYLLTKDGGATWHAGTVPGADGLDFRDVHGIDDRTAFLLSSGLGDQSRIYKTTDGGAHWVLQFTNSDPKGFLDAFGFWDAQHAIVLGDPVSGAFVVLATMDGGAHWTKLPGPRALPQEGAFAASGTCLIVSGKHECWFATGGPGGARVFHSKSSGKSWAVASTPVRNDAASAGIFSLGFSNSRNGVAVGGDYQHPQDNAHNLAVTIDGGKTWTEPAGPHPGGYRSTVAFVPDLRAWIATGTSGSEISSDGGQTWTQFDTAAYNALSFASGGAGWAVGPNGRIAEFRSAPR